MQNKVNSYKPNEWKYKSSIESRPYKKNIEN